MENTKGKTMKLRNLLTIMGLLALNYSILEVIKDLVPILQISILMLSISASICLGYTIVLYRVKKEQRLKKESMKELLQSIVKQAYNGNYNPLNEFLNSEDANRYMMQLGYFLTRHFNGNWIDKEKLFIPENLGNDLIEKLQVFFKNTIQYEDLDSDIEISTFLWTLYPERMSKVSSSLGDKNV